METRAVIKSRSKAWILAGGAHHTSFSYELDSEQLTDLANMYGIESVVIGKDTNIKEFEKELKWNDLYWRLNR